MNKKDEKLKQELVKTSKAIRKKYNALRLGQAQELFQREQTYKPITEPLKEIVKQAKINVVKSEAKLEKDEPPSPSTPKRSYKFETTTDVTTPSTSKQPTFLTTDTVAETSPTYSTDDTSAFYDDLRTNEDTLQIFLEQYDPLPRQYLEKLLKDDKKEIDYTYGVHYDQLTDSWSVGNTPIKIIGPDIQINNVTYKGTIGLYELLFKDRPSYSLIKNNDKKAYKQIMQETSLHKHGFNQQGRVKSNRGHKYTFVIKPLLEDETPSSTSKRTKTKRIQSWTGEGISSKLIYNNKPLQYVYWNKPNELINRLRFLWASKMAGNENHQNEIISILEELREEDIIY